MWLFNGKEHKKLRSVGNGRDSNDWVCHEMWVKNGKSIIYHGSYNDGPMFIGKVEIEDGIIIEIKLPDNYDEYGHFIVSNSDETLVTDGYYRKRDKIKKIKYLLKISRKLLKMIIPKPLIIVIRKFYVNENIDNLPYGEWISILKVDWEKKKIKWDPLVKHGSINCRTNQDNHPHPIFNHKGNELFFTSNRNGKRSIYKLELTNSF